VSVTAVDILKQCQLNNKGVDMRTDMQGLDSLRRLRQEWEEDAGEAYPQDVLLQLLVLYDVGKALGLTFFELRHVLGMIGFEAVKDHINSPICVDVNVTKVVAVLHG
jgi:hypothetical protein